MKVKLCSTLFLMAILIGGLTAQAQDALKVAPDHYKILLENEHVRVVENTLAPGEKDAMHTHPPGWYYVTKPGTMKVVHADGRTETWVSRAGEGGWLKTLDPHTSENTGKTTLVYVLVEVKSAAKTASLKPPKAKPAKTSSPITSTSASAAASSPGGPL